MKQLIIDTFLDFLLGSVTYAQFIDIFQGQLNINPRLMVDTDIAKLHAILGVAGLKVVGDIDQHDHERIMTFFGPSHPMFNSEDEPVNE